MEENTSPSSTQEQLHNLENASATEKAAQATKGKTWMTIVEKTTETRCVPALSGTIEKAMTQCLVALQNICCVPIAASAHSGSSFLSILSEQEQKQSEGHGSSSVTCRSTPNHTTRSSKKRRRKAIRPLKRSDAVSLTQWGILCNPPKTKTTKLSSNS